MSNDLMSIRRLLIRNRSKLSLAKSRGMALDRVANMNDFVRSKDYDCSLNVFEYSLGLYKASGRMSGSLCGLGIDKRKRALSGVLLMAC